MPGNKCQVMVTHERLSIQASCMIQYTDDDVVTCSVVCTGAGVVCGPSGALRAAACPGAPLRRDLHAAVPARGEGSCGTRHPAAVRSSGSGSAAAAPLPPVRPRCWLPAMHMHGDVWLPHITGCSCHHAPHSPQCSTSVTLFICLTKRKTSGKTLKPNPNPNAFTLAF